MESLYKLISSLIYNLPLFTRNAGLYWIRWVKTETLVTFRFFFFFPSPNVLGRYVTIRNQGTFSREEERRFWVQESKLSECLFLFFLNTFWCHLGFISVQLHSNVDIYLLIMISISSVSLLLFMTIIRSQFIKNVCGSSLLTTSDKWCRWQISNNNVIIYSVKLIKSTISTLTNHLFINFPAALHQVYLLRFSSLERHSTYYILSFILLTQYLLINYVILSVNFYSETALIKHLHRITQCTFA